MTLEIRAGNEWEVLHAIIGQKTLHCTYLHICLSTLNGIYAAQGLINFHICLFRYFSCLIISGTW